MLKALLFYKKRLDAFLSNLKHYEHKDIYWADSIKKLITHKQLCLYCHTEFEIIDMEAQDIIELLQNIIHLLETYDNYNIAFLQNSHDYTTRFENSHCIFKERQAVMLESYEPVKITPVVRLSIEEPMMLNAFEEYFKDMWEHIPPLNKDKKEVISWIQRQIDFFSKQL